MSGDLIVYGAAYGPLDVGGRVRESRKDNQITITANNATFSDSWHGTKKSLVVVFKYDNPQYPIQTSIVQENETLVISPPPGLVRQRKDRLNTTSLEKIGGILSRQPLLMSTSKSGNEIILGAAYGLADVTSKAQSLVTPKGEFTQQASNSIWGDGWHGNKKTLVVVYTYNEVYMVDAVKEGETMQFIVSPPLSILGAAYGLSIETDKSVGLMRNFAFDVTANNDTFGDGWHGEKKTLVVVYQYGEETPVVAIAEEGSQMNWMYSPGKPYLGSTDPTTLTIVGAAYGPQDVTHVVQGHVKNNTSLEITANNDTFGDTWPGKKKSLAVVYRYGRNATKTQVVEENAQLTIARKTVGSYIGIISTNNLLEDKEIFLLSGINSKYIVCDPNGKLIASSNTSESAFVFKVHKDRPDGAMKLEGNEGNYIIVGQDHCLYANSDFENATEFEISISASGGICLSVSKGLYVRIDSNDYCMKADTVDNYGASTIFEISLLKTESYGLRYQSVELSDCDIAWATFIWSLTGGFFLAIGLGPFILTGEANPGVLALIRTSPNAWAAVQNLVNVIVTGAKNNIKLAIAASLGVISTFYHEGLLWTLFKFMLKLGGWFALGWALAKIIAFVFIPEVEAAELLASFIVWGIQTVQSGLDVGQLASLAIATLMATLRVRARTCTLE